MVKTCLLSWIFFLIAVQVSAQGDTTGVHYQAVNDSVFRFFFDANYYLVDEDCEFCTIQRVGGYDRDSARFDGPFEDSNARGELLLRGTYADGRKEGRFVAYHPNGQVKWEVDFRDDQPQGYWDYYYPDGMPLMRISYADSVARILSLWNKKGRLRVKEGSGRYEFRNPIDGFSEYGFDFYTIKGPLKNGVPRGVWNVYYENSAARVQEYGSEELYRNGVLRSGNHLLDNREYSEPEFSITPHQSFCRAEALLYKPCTFDDFSGFRAYLSQALTEAFEELLFPEEQSLDFYYEIRVRKDGLAYRPRILSSMPAKLKMNFRQALEMLDFYPPSFREDRYIDDVLIVNGHLKIDPEGHVEFQVGSIERTLEDK